MITGDGAIRVQTKLDKKLYRQYGKKYLIIWSCMFALAVLLIIAELLCAFLYTEFFNIILTLCAGALCGGSLTIIISLAQSIKNADKKNCYNICEFYTDYMQVSGYENEVKISEVKIYYHMLLKRTELKDYILAYSAKNVFYPISKQELTHAELNTIQTLLSRAGTNPMQFSSNVPDNNSSYGTIPTQNFAQEINQNVFEDFPDGNGGNGGEQ